MEIIAAKHKILKIISAFLIISMIMPAVLFSSPKKAQAIPVAVIESVSDAWGWLVKAFTFITSKATTISAIKNVVVAGYAVKNWAAYIGEQLLKFAAKRLLAQMTQATINWINNDFHGSPLFLERPGSFFRDIAKYELMSLVDEFGYDELLYPFGRQFALNAIASYRRQFRDNARYTLSKVMNQRELKLFREDFNYGGWNGFLINTQYPQNNYLGFQTLMNDELARRIEGTAQAPAKKYQDLLQQGMGFLSPQTCPSNPKYNNGFNEFRRPSFQYNVPYPTPKDVPASANPADTEEILRLNEVAYQEWLNDRDKKEAEWKNANTCPGGLVNTTPGYVAANSISNALDSPRMMTLLDGALGNSVAAIFDALFNHFFDKGLNAIADMINPPPSNNDDDNWSYAGQSIADDNDTNRDLKISGYASVESGKPINVSIRVKEKTSIIISDGNRDYSIQSQSNESVADVALDVSDSFLKKLVVKGKAVGVNEVKIQDSSDPVKIAIINIAVTKTEYILVGVEEQIDVSIKVNKKTSARIAGGNGDYSVQTQSLESKAIATADIDVSGSSGNKLIVTGVSRGETTITIQDSSNPAKTALINISVGEVGDLEVKIDGSSVKTISTDTNNYDGVIATISGGEKPYSLQKSPNVAVAMASIADDNLIVVGIKNGPTFLRIKDSSGKTLRVDIKIGPDIPDNLTVSPANILTDIGNTITATISGGIEPYFLKKRPKKSIATANVSATDLVVEGIKNGPTFLIIKDSSTPAKTVKVPIAIGTDDLIITPSDISVNVSEVINIPISDGVAPYIITNNEDTDTRVATTEILTTSPATLTITGIAPGETAVTVQDSSNKTADITITTVDPNSGATLAP